MRFRDRHEGGALLARKLASYANARNTLVLALPRGGVVTGYEIARALSLPLDVIVVRKLGAPGHPELAMGAVAREGVRVLNDEVMRALRVTTRMIEDAAEREELEAERRESMFRGERPPLWVKGKNVIVVDDGLATGASMFAALEWLKMQKPAHIIVAVPVAPPDTIERLMPEVDELICLAAPRDFVAVGEWYDEFEQVSDREVVDLLHAAARQPALAQ